MCGENLENPTACFPVQGSSPRVRGKRARRKRIVARSGLIPAYAGKTCIWSLLTKPGRAHPRVCGENLEYAARRPNRAGSSPRVRGKPMDQLADKTNGRLIPARAGKTDLEPGTMVRLPAHPRVCGENRVSVVERADDSGSSPRVRGKRDSHTGERVANRLIPACAGKTLSRHALHLSRRAHPRVCGENCVSYCGMCCVWGSSPRVRGKRVSLCGMVIDFRLIPACAGKTSTTAVSFTLNGAHPRVCGENLVPSVRIPQLPGSSPRVRGKPPVDTNPVGGGGLIPACAGKTAAMFLTPSQSWAHPRVCGENRRASRRERPGMGSSPRVRGKPSPWKAKAA